MAHKVMVVDDEPATLKLLESILSSNGYEVVSATNGLDALVGIQNEHPELVVLDVMIPEVNGYDVCFQLRFNSEFKKIPIILLTKRDQEIDDRIGERVNIAYVPKPINSEKLLQKIQDLLS